MHFDATNFVNSCPTCITSKPQRTPIAPFQNSFILTRPGQFLSLDFVGMFNNGYRILTLIDHFSKHLKLYPLRQIITMNTVEAIFDCIATFGRPELILSDVGSQFKAHIFQEFNRMLGIKLKHTTVFHPQANTVSERINMSIKSPVKSSMKDGYNFFNAIKIHQCIYNSTFHNTIKASPGRALSNIFDTFQSTDFQNWLELHQDYFILMNNFQQLYNQVHHNLINYQNLQNN